MTRRDLLEGNVDLIARAARILKSKKTRTLQLATTRSAPFNQVQVTATNVDRVDLVVDDRPVASADIGSGAPISITLPKPATARNRVEAFGYRKGERVVRTRLGA